MTNEKLTNWFDGSIKPKRYGWYDAQVRIWLDDDLSFFEVEKRLLYKHRVWWMKHPKLDHIAIRVRPPIKWRGRLMACDMQS